MIQDTRKTLLTRNQAERYEVEIMDLGFQTEVLPIYGMGSTRSTFGYAVIVRWDGGGCIVSSQEHASSFYANAEDESLDDEGHPK